MEGTTAVDSRGFEDGVIDALDTSHKHEGRVAEPHEVVDDADEGTHGYGLTQEVIWLIEHARMDQYRVDWTDVAEELHE